MWPPQGDGDRVVPGPAPPAPRLAEDVLGPRRHAAFAAAAALVQRASAGRVLVGAVVAVAVAVAPDQQGVERRPQLASGGRQLVEVRSGGATGGSVALAIGVGLIALSASEDSAVTLLAGAAVAGVGFGLALLGALRTLSAAVPPDQRAGVMSAFFVVGYAALSIPAVMAGLAVTPLGFESTFEIFGVTVAAVALAVAVQAWRTRPRPAAQLATEATWALPRR
jgi:hypothetical protein